MCHPLSNLPLPDSTAPATAADLVERICHERTRLETLLKKLPRTRLFEPLVGGGWSIGDHLAHLTAWRRVLLDVLQGRLAVDDIATVEVQAIGQVPGMLNDFRTVHLDALAEVMSKTQTELDRPVDLGELSMRDFIAACTYRHDRRHREAIT